MGYMIPPFIARESEVLISAKHQPTTDLGLVTNSSALLLNALKQHEWESGYIQDNKTDLYRHVNQDWGQPFWATGDGWMTYGLMRVVSFSEALSRSC
jgi:rhamnogalacturonyl hydrolase YesR